MKKLLVLACLLGLSACHGAKPETPSAGESAQALAAEGAARIEAVHTVSAERARAEGLAVGPEGEVVVAGGYSDEFGSWSDEDRGTFLLSFDEDLDPHLERRLEIPGLLRGLFAHDDGITLVTDAADPPAGPFVTELDYEGQARARHDLSLGGVATSVIGTNDGLLIRLQADGVRLVRLGADAEVRNASKPLAPRWAHEFPSTVEENGLISQVALLPDGSAMTIHARALTGAPDEPRQQLSRVSASGDLVWQRDTRLGHNVQLVSLGDGVLALCPEADALCPSLRPGGGFALVRIDAQGELGRVHCTAGKVAGLRLVSNGREAALGGQFTGPLSLSRRTFATEPDYLRSFLAWLSADGAPQQALAFGDAVKLVVLQSLAMAGAGHLALAGALGWTKPGKHPTYEQSHLFVAIVQR